MMPGCTRAGAGERLKCAHISVVFIEDGATTCDSGLTLWLLRYLGLCVLKVANAVSLV